MTEALLPPEIQPEEFFTALLPEVCEALQTDRCFLQVRNSAQRLYRIFCWRRSPQFPDISTESWQLEDAWEEDDPMFAAALRAAPSIFVEDVETTAPEVLNLNFERNFGHRALIHAHICQDGVLHGILQPCVFANPRVWSERDRAIVSQVVDKIRPWVVRYGETARQSEGTGLNLNRERDVQHFF